ncbi:MAG: HEAT repeat domain-containing protein [Algisphaera sp.]
MRKATLKSIFTVLTPLLLMTWGCQSPDPLADAGPPPEGMTTTQWQVQLASTPTTPPDLRSAALEALAASPVGGESLSRKLYQDVLLDPQTDATVSATCALALERHSQQGDGQGDAKTVATLLTHDTAYTRWVAAVVLQRIHDPSVTGELIRTLDDEDADVRTAIAMALGQYPRRDVYDALVQALEDADYGVARAAQHSLTLIADHDGDDDPSAWLSHAKNRGAKLFETPRPYTYDRYDGTGGRNGVLRRMMGKRDALISETPTKSKTKD